MSFSFLVVGTCLMLGSIFPMDSHCLKPLSKRERGSHCVCVRERESHCVSEREIFVSEIRHGQVMVIFRVCYF